MGRFHGNWDTSARRNLRRVLVVGAGRAGVAAAEELRRQGFGGEITVMCDERSAPYDRPSCSKGLLTGHKRPKDARMPVQDDLAIHWAMGRTAVHLDPTRRIVTADTDEEFGYDGLVIATGARPVWPKGWPTGEPGLHQLHGLDDAWSLRRALHRAKRVAVVGGGLTGCEVAGAVRSMARECVLIDSRQQLMSRALGEVVGQYVTGVVARDGVQLRLGRRCRQLDRHRRGWVLTLDDGSQVLADLVVATVGERPDTAWLADTGFDLSDGVLCDENLRVVGAEDVVAAGTVARWPNVRYGTEPRRVGQWIMALEQGRAAAAALLGSDHPARPAALVPRFWSEQFGLRIQVCGEVDVSAEVSVERKRPGRRDAARAGVLVGYHRNGQQIGVVAVNAVRAFTTMARSMLAAPATPPPGTPALPPAPRPHASPAGAHPLPIGAHATSSRPRAMLPQHAAVPRSPEPWPVEPRSAVPRSPEPGWDGRRRPGYAPGGPPPPGYGPPGYGPPGPAYGPGPSPYAYRPAEPRMIAAAPAPPPPGVPVSPALPAAGPYDSPRTIDVPPSAVSEVWYPPEPAPQWHPPEAAERWEPEPEEVAQVRPRSPRDRFTGQFAAIR